jgi:glycine/D-amino acid oxidase-like deaminating enzyme
MGVAIIGSGIIGLLSALTVTEAGYEVTIIARDLPGDETQDWASPWYVSPALTAHASEAHS